jgi:hypothetical protein
MKLKSRFVNSASADIDRKEIAVPPNAVITICPPWAMDR